MRLGNAFHISRALQVAARFDLGRLLEPGPRRVDDLARATGTDASALHRFLRFLAELGVVEEVEDDLFGPTPLSQSLHLIDNVAQGDEAWGVWGALPEALRSGGTVFEAVHGMPFYQYVVRHPKQRAHWDEWNARMGAAQLGALARRLSLRGDETVVDVGGGRGDLLAVILETYPQSRGVLFDLPEVVAEAPERLRRAGVEARCRVEAGSAFDRVPEEGDVYLLTRS